MFKYSWDKRDAVSAAPLAESIFGEAGLLYSYSVQSDYDYDGMQCFVLPAEELFCRSVTLCYYTNLGRLINSANVMLDHFDQWKDAWKADFETLAKPAVESLGGNTVEMTDEAMITTYTDAHQNRIILSFRYDVTGWQKFMADKDYGPRVPRALLTEDGLPLDMQDESL